MLVGRDRDLTKVVENMQLGVHTLVFGPEGTGKSALLREAALQINRNRPASLRAVYVCDCSGCRNLLSEALVGLPLENRNKPPRRLYPTSRIEGWLRVQDLRDQLFSAARSTTLCLLLDHLPPLHHKMQRLLEMLEQRFTLACAVTANRAAYDLYYWKFEKIELADLPTAMALGWVEDELRIMGYGGSLRAALAREIIHQAGSNPGLISRTLDVIRSQPRRLDDPIRVARMFIDGLLNTRHPATGPRKSSR